MQAEAYDRIMEERGLWDFDDILINTYKLMKEGEVPKDRFSYLLVTNSRT